MVTQLTMLFLKKVLTLFEIGLGTVTDATPDTLARDTVLSNSSGNTSKITFSGGTLSVFCTMPASKTVYLDSSGYIQ